MGQTGRQAELELKAGKADLLGTGSASAWDGRYIRQYISWMNQAWAGRCDGNRVLVFRGTRTICQKELKAMTSSDKALKGIKLFVSPEYENPSDRKEKKPFFSRCWSAH